MSLISLTRCGLVLFPLHYIFAQLERERWHVSRLLLFYYSIEIFPDAPFALTEIMLKKKASYKKTLVIIRNNVISALLLMKFLHRYYCNRETIIKSTETNVIDCFTDTKIHRFNFTCYTFCNRGGIPSGFCVICFFHGCFPESVRDSETNNVIILAY